MKKVMVVFGTRPEAIKMCPVVCAIRETTKLRCVVCVTGQHREMLQQVLEVFRIIPEYDLQVMQKQQTLFDITNRILERMEKILELEKPDVVLVHGDTTTTFVTTLACFYKQIAVGHVEAGLRTYDIYSPYPEEFNRQAVSIVAKYHFAPTELARKNLLNEGKNEADIYVTGNTAIDALQTTLRSDCKHEIFQKIVAKRCILLTAHRRENLGEPLYRMFRAVRRIIEEFEDIEVVYPIHMNPMVRDCAKEVFMGCDRIHLIEPLDVVEFHKLMEKSYLILTDSGGIQEEAPALGKPVLVMRETTERPEGIEAGTLMLVGTDEERIYQECRKLLIDDDAYRRMSQAKNPYGDGTASLRIARILESSLVNE